MRWKKLGLLYNPTTLHPKLATHASNPLAVLLEGNVYRVYFSGRDSDNRSSVGFADIDIVKRQVLYVHDRPAFEHGPDGSFYAAGVSVGNNYECDGRRFLLFMGWQRPLNDHWRGDIGRLVLETDSSLNLDTDGPVKILNAPGSMSHSYPCVIREEDGRYRMWYGSTLTWDAGNGEMLHVIEQATSSDGQNWNHDGVTLPYRIGLAQAFSRPSVIGNRRLGYRMWFSYRGGPEQKYRIGYATSADGTDWQLRLEETGIDVSTSGWDSEMIEYPHVFQHNGELFMLYNGDGYGRTGFGIAVLMDE